MARRVSVNYCMLCDSTPCTCSAAPKTIKKRALTAPPVKSLPKQLSSPVPKVPVTPAVKPKLTIELSEEDALFNAALRALNGAGLLSHSDRDKYRHILASEASASERAIAWRARRRLDNA